MLHDGLDPDRVALLDRSGITIFALPVSAIIRTR
jgi:hypothetical protein